MPARIQQWLHQRRIRRLRPIVIGGCARSGTSLLLSVLSAHPHIVAIPQETQLLCPGAYWPPAGGISKPDMEQVFELLKEMDISADVQAWSEKTPRNICNAESILDSLGRRTRLINIVRDGRDVVLSRHPKKPDEYWVSPNRWVSDVQAGLLMRHHPQVMTVRYEDFVRDPCSAIPSLCEFLSLDYDARLLEYPSHVRISESESWFEPARPFSVESIGKWRLPEHVDRVQRLLDEPGACELLNEFGYDV